MWAAAAVTEVMTLRPCSSRERRQKAPTWYDGLPRSGRRTCFCWPRMRPVPRRESWRDSGVVEVLSSAAAKYDRSVVCSRGQVLGGPGVGVRGVPTACALSTYIRKILSRDIGQSTGPANRRCWAPISSQGRGAAPCTAPMFQWLMLHALQSSTSALVFDRYR